MPREGSPPAKSTSVPQDCLSPQLTGSVHIRPLAVQLDTLYLFLGKLGFYEVDNLVGLIIDGADSIAIEFMTHVGLISQH